MNYMEKYGKILKERSLQEKYHAKALAFLKRGIMAGIPKNKLRINEKSFSELLSPEYEGHPEVNGFSSFVYNNANELLEIPFIIIDGGDFEARRSAGFALLFRLIACDNFGLYRGCTEMVHKLQTIHSINGENRNDIVDMLKSYDILFISEFDSRLFRDGFDTGDFFDELLGSRQDKMRPTIISFTKALSSKAPISNTICGHYLSNLSIREYCTSKNPSSNPANDTLRIRVKGDMI